VTLIIINSSSNRNKCHLRVTYDINLVSSVFCCALTQLVPLCQIDMCNKLSEEVKNLEYQ
jgi:hypothetical protein